MTNKFADRYFLPINGLLDGQGAMISQEEAFSLISEPLALVTYNQDFLSRLDNHTFAHIDTLGIIGGSLDDHMIFLFGGLSPAAQAITDSKPYHLGLAMTEHTINWSKAKTRPFTFLGSLEGSDFCPRFNYKGTMGTQKTRYFLNKTIREFENPNSNAYKEPSFLRRQ